MHLHQFTTYVLFRSCLRGGGDCRKLTEIRRGGRVIRPLKILEPPSPPFGDKIYNEWSLTDPVFPLPQSERRKLVLKIMSMDPIYIFHLFLFLNLLFTVFFFLGKKGSSDAPAWRGTVNIAFREF